MLWEQLVRRTREGKGRHSDNSHGRSFPKRRKWRATSWHLCELFYCYGALLNLYQSLPIFITFNRTQQDIRSALNHHRNHTPRCRSTRSKRTACWLTSFGWSLLKRSWARAATTVCWLLTLLMSNWKMFVTCGSSAPMGKWRTYTSIWNHRQHPEDWHCYLSWKKKPITKASQFGSFLGKSFFQTQTGSWINVSSPQPWITMTITPIIPFNSPKQYRKSIIRFRPISEMGRIQNHHNHIRSLSIIIPEDPRFPGFFLIPCFDCR